MTLRVKNAKDRLKITRVVEAEGHKVVPQKGDRLTVTMQGDFRRFLRQSGLFTKEECEILEGDSYWDYFFGP